MKDVNEESLKKLDLAVKVNQLGLFLLEAGNYKLYDGPNQSMLNASAVMECIYSYSRSKFNLRDELQKNLEMIAGLDRFGFICVALEYVSFQLKSEKNNKAPFKLDNEKILQILKKNISDNKELFSGSGEIWEQKFNNGINFLRENYDEDLNENFGQKIL